MYFSEEYFKYKVFQVVWWSLFLAKFDLKGVEHTHAHACARTHARSTNVLKGYLTLNFCNFVEWHYVKPFQKFGIGFTISFDAFDNVFVIFALECIWFISSICINLVGSVSRFDKRNKCRAIVWLNHYY